MIEMEVDVKELERAQREIEEKLAALSGPDMVGLMRTATLIVQRDAKINAPVDTGRLRASITPSVTAHGNRIDGVVGSNVRYAPYQEFGTRYMEGRRYLWRAFTENEERIRQLLGDVILRIINR